MNVMPPVNKRIIVVKYLVFVCLVICSHFAYAMDNYGARKVYLHKNEVNGVNTLTQSMFQNKFRRNTIYAIQDDFVLGENIRIPHSCTLLFDGGSIEGPYSISFHYTKLDGNVRINCRFDGSLVNSEVHTKWFCRMDGQSDETDALIDVLKTAPSTIVFDKGTYDVAIRKNRKLAVNSNQSLIFEQGAVLKRINENDCMNSIINIVGVDNVHIFGGEFYGDQESNTNSSPGASHGIFIKNSSNITIKNAYVHNIHTDCCYISGSEQVLVSNCRFSYSGRGGVCIISGKDITISDCIQDHAESFAPKFGFGIEPNYSTEKHDDIVFRNCVASDNNGPAFYYNFAKFPDSDKNDKTVSFENCTGYHSSFLLGGCTPAVKIRGRILINNYTSIDAKGAIFVSGVNDAEKGVPVIINNPKVINGNTNKYKNVYGHFFSLQYANNNIKHGNIRIVNADLKEKGNTIDAIGQQDNMGDFDVRGGDFVHVSSKSGPVSFLGDFPLSVKEFTAASVESMSYRRVIFNTFDNDITGFVFRKGIPKGQEVTIEKKGKHKLSFVFLELSVPDKSIYSGARLICTVPNAYIKLVWTDDNVACVTDISNKSDWIIEPSKKK